MKVAKMQIETVLLFTTGYDITKANIVHIWREHGHIL